MRQAPRRHRGRVHRHVPAHRARQPIRGHRLRPDVLHAEAKRARIRRAVRVRLQNARLFRRRRGEDGDQRSARSAAHARRPEASRPPRRCARRMRKRSLRPLSNPSEQSVGTRAPGPRVGPGRASPKAPCAPRPWPSSESALRCTPKDANVGAKNTDVPPRTKTNPKRRLGSSEDAPEDATNSRNLPDGTERAATDHPFRNASRTRGFRVVANPPTPSSTRSDPIVIRRIGSAPRHARGDLGIERRRRPTRRDAGRRRRRRRRGRREARRARRAAAAAAAAAAADATPENTAPHSNCARGHQRPRVEPRRGRGHEQEAARRRGGEREVRAGGARERNANAFFLRAGDTRRVA